MTCDGCRGGRWAHFCLVSACLSVFMSWSESAVFCALMIHAGYMDANIFLSSCNFSLHICICLFAAPCYFCAILSWPCLFCSSHFPYLSFSAFPPFTFAFAFLLLPATSVSFLLTLSPLLCVLSLFIVTSTPHSPWFVCFFFFVSQKSAYLFAPFLSQSHALSICPSVHPLISFLFCPFSVIQEKPPSCSMTFSTPSPSRLSWCLAAVESPHWWPKLLACGTLLWWASFLVFAQLHAFRTFCR